MEHIFGENARAEEEAKSKKIAAERAPVVRLLASILRFDLCSRAGVGHNWSCGDAQDRDPNRLGVGHDDARWIVQSTR